MLNVHLSILYTLAILQSKCLMMTNSVWCLRGHPFITFAKFWRFWTPPVLNQGWYTVLYSRNLTYLVHSHFGLIFWPPPPLCERNKWIAHYNHLLVTGRPFLLGRSSFGPPLPTPIPSRRSSSWLARHRYSSRHGTATGLPPATEPPPDQDLHKFWSRLVRVNSYSHALCSDEGVFTVLTWQSLAEVFNLALIG